MPEATVLPTPFVSFFFWSIRHRHRCLSSKRFQLVNMENLTKIVRGQDSLFTPSLTSLSKVALGEVWTCETIAESYSWIRHRFLFGWGLVANMKPVSTAPGRILRDHLHNTHCYQPRLKGLTFPISSPSIGHIGEREESFCQEHHPHQERRTKGMMVLVKQYGHQQWYDRYRHNGNWKWISIATILYKELTC